MQNASKPRARLSEAQVVTIFQAKAADSQSTASKVAADYGVSEKAIRDIWNGRTWSRETWHLDTSRPLQLKQSGRPKGCRDSKPRKRRAGSRVELSSSTGSISELCSRQEEAQPPSSDYVTLISGLSQCSDTATCVEELSAMRKPKAACWSLPTLCHASVDEQLHEWDAFWHASASADPFRDDWGPH